MKPKKKVVLFPEIGLVKIFSSLTHPHSRMCIRIYIFSISKNKETSKKPRKQKRQKKISKRREYLWKIDYKNKFVGTRVKIFLVTSIFGSHRFFIFWPDQVILYFSFLKLLMQQSNITIKFGNLKSFLKWQCPLKTFLKPMFSTKNQ